MKKLTIAIIFLLIMTLPLFAASDVAGGVTIEAEVSYRGTDYSLNGARIRTKFIIRLYVGSLYTDRTITNETAVLNGPVSSVIRLDIISGIITSKLMKETIQEGFEKAMNGDTSSMQNQIDDFIGIFSEAINIGDQFNFISTPGTGVIAYKGDRELATINDDQFRKVLFSIWLGNNPADKRLKKLMLGG